MTTNKNKYLHHYGQQKVNTPTDCLAYDVKVATSLVIRFTTVGLSVIIPPRKLYKQQQKKYIIFKKSGKGIAVKEEASWKSQIIDTFVEETKIRYTDEYMHNLLCICVHKLTKEEIAGLKRIRIKWYIKIIKIILQTIKPTISFVIHFH
eukprot:221969_1